MLIQKCRDSDLKKMVGNGTFLALVCYSLYVVILSLDSFQFQFVKGFENIC